MTANIYKLEETSKTLNDQLESLGLESDADHPHRRQVPTAARGPLRNQDGGPQQFD